MLVYATEEDLITYTGDVHTPDNVDRLIAAASALVRRATRTAHYSTTPAGAPSDADIADGFRDAVCAQIQWWSDNEIDPQTATARIGSGVKSKSIGSASITYEDTSAATAVAAVTLCQPAVDILDDLNLSTAPISL